LSTAVGAGPQGTAAPPMVEARGVRKSFGHVEVLKGIDLTVAPREVMCIVGPSGSGKSTFLRCINHLERIDAGRLFVDGELIGYRQRGDRLYEMKPVDAARQRRDIGMVFQHFNLFPHMTALENVIEAPMRVKGATKRDAEARGRDLLTRVGVKPQIGH
jgi:polar amino acid transport system ATP-binding protein